MASSPHARHWALDPEVTFLNHGSFGACPSVVLDEQRRWRERMERQPVRFLHRELEPLLDQVRAELGRFVGAEPDDLALIDNATAGVNTVLQRLDFGPDDELLVTDLEYNASRNALDFVAARCGARVVVAKVPFPIADPQQVIDAVLGAVGARTRLLLIDHVTSSTGMVLPVPQIVAALRARGVDTLVDGAHAPGMLALDLDALGAAYFTGNCHKWLCTPKGSAFLHVRRDRQHLIRPLAISHGANSPRRDRSRFRLEHDWLGTQDPSPWLCIPRAIAFLGGLFDTGFEGLRRHNRALVLEGRARIAAAIGAGPACPDSMIGSLASIELPESGGSAAEIGPLGLDPLQVALFDDERIEVPVMPGPRPPQRLLRISAQAYNDRRQFERLAEAVARRC